MPSPPPPSKSISPVLIGAPFLLVALGLVLGHRLFSSPASFERAPEELLQTYERAVPAEEWEAMQPFLQNEEAVILHGKALYPVYFEADEGMENFNWASFAPQPYPRLAFYLIGPRSISVNLPLESAPAHFPAGAEVIVIGCWSEAEDINAAAVLLPGDPPIHIRSEPFPACRSAAP